LPGGRGGQCDVKDAGKRERIGGERVLSTFRRRPCADAARLPFGTAPLSRVEADAASAPYFGVWLTVVAANGSGVAFGWLQT